jgi:hypothetical protein
MSGDAFGILIGAALLLGGLPIILGTAAVGMAAATVLRLGAEAVGEGVRRHRQSQLEAQDCSAELSGLYDQLRATMEREQAAADAYRQQMYADMQGLSARIEQAAVEAVDASEMEDLVREARSASTQAMGEHREAELERIRTEAAEESARIMTTLDAAQQARIEAVDWQRTTEAARAQQRAMAQDLLRDAQASLRVLETMERTSGDVAFGQKVAAVRSSLQTATSALEAGHADVAAASAQKVISRGASLALEHEQQLFERDEVAIALTAQLEALLAQLDAAEMVEFDDEVAGHVMEYLDDFTQGELSVVRDQVQAQLELLASDEGRELTTHQLQLMLDDVDDQLVPRADAVVSLGHEKLMRYYERIHALQTIQEHMAKQGYEMDWARPAGGDATQKLVVHFREPVTGNGISVSLDEDEDVEGLERMAMEVMFYYANGSTVSEAQKQAIRDGMVRALHEVGLGGDLACTGSVGTESSDQTMRTAEQVEQQPVAPLF